MKKLMKTLATIGGCFISGIALGTCAFYLRRATEKPVCVILDDDAGDDE